MAQDSNKNNSLQNTSDALKSAAEAQTGSKRVWLTVAAALVLGVGSILTFYGCEEEAALLDLIGSKTVNSEKKPEQKTENPSKESSKDENISSEVRTGSL